METTDEKTRKEAKDKAKKERRDIAILVVLTLALVFLVFWSMNLNFLQNFFYFNLLAAAGILILGTLNSYRPKKKVSVWFAWSGIALLWVAIFVDLVFVALWTFHNGLWPLLIIAAFVWRKSIISFPEKLFVKIQDNPTHCGVIEVWGKRPEETVTPGYKPYAPFFPFKLKYHLISLVQRKNEITMTVWCKSDEEISVECVVRFSIIWTPNSEKTDDFINTGEGAGIIDRLSDITEAKVEKFSEEKQWGDFLSDKNGVRKILTKSITNKSSLSIKTGTPDSHNLGILVFDIMVDDVEPVSAVLKDAMLGLAIEQRQRKSQQYQRETDIQSAKEMVAKFEGGLSLMEAFALVQEARLLDEAKATKDFSAFKGLNNVGGGAALLAGLHEGSKGGGK